MLKSQYMAIHAIIFMASAFAPVASGDLASTLDCTWSLPFYNRFNSKPNVGDNANFVTSGNPWFIRGGNSNNGANAGVFAFNNANGDTNTNNAWRAVVSGF
jgi:hypothetical protein